MFSRRRFDQNWAQSRSRGFFRADAELAASVAAALFVSGTRRVAGAEIGADSVGFLDDGRALAEFDAFAARGSSGRTRLLHAGVIFDDAIVRIWAFVVEARI